MLKRLLLGTSALLLIAVISLAVYISPILGAGSGYAAKNICSGYFLSGMPANMVVDQALVGASPLLGATSYSVDEGSASVRTRLFGLFPRTAVFSDAIGCTLLPNGEEQPRHKVLRRSFSTIDPEVAWPTGSGAANAPKLEAIVAKAFLEEDTEAPRDTKAVVVIHQGELVAEKYAQGIGPQTPLLGWSMTKSVTNMLIGLLVADGVLSVNDPAPVPQWQVEPGDPRSQITVEQMLHMSTGLAFSETYAAGSDVTQMLSGETDTAAFAASKPLLAGGVGNEWYYSSGTTNILAGIVRRAVGGSPQDIYDFAQQRLFEPLQIRTATMEQDASGTPIGSSYMYASARDWARLGQFALQQGKWNGVQLLPEDWISYSTKPAPANVANDYGAHFWLNRNPSDGRPDRRWPLLPEDTFAMSGYQGQRVFIIPSRQLVVTRFGFTPKRNHGMEETIHQLLQVLPRNQP